MQAVAAVGFGEQVVADVDELYDLPDKTSLLCQFPQDRGGRRFTEFQSAARQCPDVPDPDRWRDMAQEEAPSFVPAARIGRDPYPMARRLGAHGASRTRGSAWTAWRIAASLAPVSTGWSTPRARIWIRAVW